MRNQDVRIQGIVTAAPSACDEVVEDLRHKDFRGCDAASGHGREEVRGVEFHGAGFVCAEVIQLLGGWHASIERGQAASWALPPVVGRLCPQQEQRGCASVAGQFWLHASWSVALYREGSKG